MSGYPRQNPLDALQVGDLGMDGGQVLLCAGLHLRASLAAAIDQFQRAANLFDCKTKLTPAQDEV